MPILELFIELKIPDTCAITTLNTIHRLGYKSIKKIKRYDYYKFDVANIDKFIEEIPKLDVLINVNKHKYYIKRNSENGIYKIFPNESTTKPILILVKNTEQDNALLYLLRNRFDIKDIISIDKGILWGLYFSELTETQRIKLAMRIGKSILSNEHYQRIDRLALSLSQ